MVKTWKCIMIKIAKVPQCTTFVLIVRVRSFGSNRNSTNAGRYGSTPYSMAWEDAENRDPTFIRSGVMCQLSSEYSTILLMPSDQLLDHAVLIYGECSHTFVGKIWGIWWKFRSCFTLSSFIKRWEHCSSCRRVTKYFIYGKSLNFWRLSIIIIKAEQFATFKIRDDFYLGLNII